MLSWSIRRCWVFLVTAADGTDFFGGCSRAGIEDFFTLRALSILVRRMWLCRSISRNRSFVNDMLIRRVWGTDTELEGKVGQFWLWMGDGMEMCGAIMRFSTWLSEGFNTIIGQKKRNIIHTFKLWRRKTSKTTMNHHKCQTSALFFHILITYLVFFPIINRTKSVFLNAVVT